MAVSSLESRGARLRNRHLPHQCPSHRRMIALKGRRGERLEAGLDIDPDCRTEQIQKMLVDTGASQSILEELGHIQTTRALKAAEEANRRASLQALKNHLTTRSVNQLPKLALLLRHPFQNTLSLTGASD